MIHASLRAVGPILGGPDTLLDAIAEDWGEGGTLMMHVGCQSPFDEVGRGIWSPVDENRIKIHCPAFNPAAARSNRSFGSLAEIFRTRPGAVASAHIGARMAALGTRRHALMAGHSLDYGYGPDSPLGTLYKDGGQVLLIGGDLDHVTLLRYAEHIAPIADKRLVRYQSPLLREGVREWVSIEEYDTYTGIRLWPDRFCARIIEAFIATVPQCAGKVGDTPAWLLDARSLVDFAVPMMIAQAARQAA